MTVLKIVVVTVAVLLSGCASQSIYNWENYSNTLYELTNDYSEASETKHYNELIKIVSRASAKKKVPPGIYFELGMFEEKRGNREKSKEYFMLELQTYPESKVFVEKTLQGERSE